MRKSVTNLAGAISSAAGRRKVVEFEVEDEVDIAETRIRFQHWNRGELRDGHSFADACAASRSDLYDVRSFTDHDWGGAVDMGAVTDFVRDTAPQPQRLSWGRA